MSCNIKIKKTKNFVVFFEKSHTRDGVVYKVTICVKPRRQGCALRKVQVQSVHVSEFVSYRQLLSTMLKKKSKMLLREMQASK